MTRSTPASSHRKGQSAPSARSDAGVRRDAPGVPGRLLSLQRAAGNRAVAGMLSSATTDSEILQVSRQPKAKPDTAPLKAQLEGRAHDMLERFNFEMNTLQNNLGIVAAVADTAAIPKFSLGTWFMQRLVSEGLESIPFAPVAEGLKVAWDVYVKYSETDKAAKAVKLRNQIQVFTATKHNDLELQQAAFALVHDMLVDAAKSGDADKMSLALTVAPDSRSLGDIVKQGVAYRVALNQAFLAQFVKMRAVIYDPGRLRTEVLGPISPAAMRERISGEGPQYSLADLGPTGPGGQGAGGWVLRRWMTPTDEHMTHLTGATASGGAGLSYGDLYYWYRTEPKAGSEVRIAGTQDPSFPQHEVYWLFGS